MNNRYIFVNKKTEQDIMTYNPEPKLFSYYQLCLFRNPDTKRYHCKKYIVNQDLEFKKITNHKLSEEQFKKFLKTKNPNQYKLYSTYDDKLFNTPHVSEICQAQSLLINANNKEYDFMEFNN
jgi:hypothetical protein